MSKALYESLKMDLPALAEMLRSKGRKGDAILAHISPKEAALLKRKGGAGTTNPETGLPEFYGEDGGYDPIGASQEGFTYTGPEAPPVAAYDPMQASQEGFSYTGPTAAYDPIQAGQTGFDYSGAPGQQISPTQTAYTPNNVGMSGADIMAYQTANAPGAVTPPGQEDKSIADRLGLKTSDLTRLGLGGLVAGGLTAQNLARTRQAQQQAGQAQGELQALGTPYQSQGKELVRAAQSGELTPANQQIINAARAQANQAVATRGGVGQQQAQNSISDLTARLLQGQYDLGLKVMNIGDNYVSGAIKTGLQADQMVNQANQQFYASLAQMAAPFLLGQQPVYQVTPPRA